MFTLNAETVAVIGVGNVAVDIARLLSKTAHELRSTDIPGDVLAVLTRSRVRDVMIIGRRGPAQAKFTTKELRELGELANVDIIVPPGSAKCGPYPCRRHPRFLLNHEIPHLTEAMQGGSRRC